MRAVRQFEGNDGGRLPGLDTLRAAATVAVVLLHAAVPFSLTPMPGLAWPVRHPDPSGVVDVVFWTIACCVMPVFFWLSGYGAAHSLASRGVRAFLHARWRRIGIPLFAFGTILLPFELYLWLIGWALEGRIPWHKLRSLKMDNVGLWGLSHLWYLEYLLLYCGLLAAWDWVCRSRFAHGVRPVGFAIKVWRSPARFVVLTAVVAAVLWWSPKTVVGFQHSFFPVPAKFAFTGLFFVAGVLTFRAGAMHLSNGTVPMACAAAMLWAIFPWLQRQGTVELLGWDRVVLAVGLAGFAALMTGGLWDLCARQRASCPRLVRFASSSSYWTYLVHHPVVALCHIALRPTGWPALVQFLLTAAMTLAACWLSYLWFVEGTALDELLGSRSSDRGLPTVEGAEPLRRAA